MSNNLISYIRSSLNSKKVVFGVLNLTKPDLMITYLTVYPKKNLRFPFMKNILNLNLKTVTYTITFSLITLPYLPNKKL